MDKNNVFSKIFNWMGFGFLLTFITGYVISTTNDFINVLFGTKLYLLFALIEIVLVLVLSAKVHKLKKSEDSDLVLFCFLEYNLCVYWVKVYTFRR